MFAGPEKRLNPLPAYSLSPLTQSWFHPLRGQDQSSQQKNTRTGCNNTTSIMVCQGVAPNAKEPTVKCLGTLKIASSAMEKIVGMTANPLQFPLPTHSVDHNRCPIRF